LSKGLDGKSGGILCEVSSVC